MSAPGVLRPQASERDREGLAGWVGRGEVRTPPRPRGGRGRLRPEGGGQKAAQLGGYSEGLGGRRVRAGNAFWTPPVRGGGEVKASVNWHRLRVPALGAAPFADPLSAPLPRPCGFHGVCFREAPGDRARWSSFFLMAIGESCMRVSF